MGSRGGGASGWVGNPHPHPHPHPHLTLALALALALTLTLTLETLAPALSHLDAGALGVEEESGEDVREHGEGQDVPGQG